MRITNSFRDRKKVFEEGIYSYYEIDSFWKSNLISNKLNSDVLVQSSKCNKNSFRNAPLSASLIINGETQNWLLKNKSLTRILSFFPLFTSRFWTHDTTLLCRVQDSVVKLTLEKSRTYSLLCLSNRLLIVKN